METVVVGTQGSRWTYRESDYLGGGGFGKVYKARDTVGGFAAMKRIDLPKHASAADIAILSREAAIARSKLMGYETEIEHLVVPLDVVTTTNELYIVMPLADAALDTEIKQQRVHGVGPAAEILLQVASGLRELASLGVLHRDMKPANVLRVDGKWKLADFGLSRDSDVSTATFTLLGAGSYPYMAPETWRLEPASQRTDLYAVGVIAYELLTGHRPFSGGSRDRWRQQHLEEMPADLPESVPLNMRRVISRLLRKQPAARFEDARELVDALLALRRSADGDSSPLLRAAAMFEQRVAVREVAEVAADGQARSDDDLRVTALARLEATFDDAVEEIRSQLSDIVTTRDDSGLFLKWRGVILEINLWQSFSTKEDRPDRRLICAGEVVLRAPSVINDTGVQANRDADHLPVDMNIVCIAHEGWPEWKLHVVDHDVDPHGLPEGLFAEHWKRVVDPGSWVVFREETLTKDSIIHLLELAIKKLTD